MPLRSDCVGLEISSGPLEVPARWLLSAAAALGLEEEQYCDDARAGGLMAPPFVCTRFEWMLQGRLRVHPALGLSPQETRRGVHFVQDSRFLAPLVAGMRVEAVGTISEVKPVKAGALIRYAYRLRDLGTGRNLTETRSIGIFRDVAVPDGARALSGYVAPSGEAPAPLDRTDAETTEIAIPRAFAHIYTECLDIWNPVHTERQVAVAAGLPDIILHGTATWALAGLTILRRHARDDVGALRRLTGRFSGMVMPGEDIVVRHERSGDIVRFEVRTASGAVAMSQGVAWLGG